jgi:hypothetical protein
MRMAEPGNPCATPAAVVAWRFSQGNPLSRLPSRASSASLHVSLPQTPSAPKKRSPSQTAATGRRGDPSGLASGSIDCQCVTCRKTIIVLLIVDSWPACT